MPVTANRDWPDDIRGWREAVDRARNIYWSARRNGSDENAALYAVLDDCLRDNFDFESSRRKDGQ